MTTSLHERKPHSSAFSNDVPTKVNDSSASNKNDTAAKFRYMPKQFIGQFVDWDVYKAKGFSGIEMKDLKSTKKAKSSLFLFAIFIPIIFLVRGYKGSAEISNVRGLKYREGKRLLAKSNYTIVDVAAAAIGETGRIQAKGEDADEKEPKISLVISYCDKPLGWIAKFVGEKYKISDINIVSKCRDDVEGLPELQEISENVNVIRLPNVGDWEHSYAFWIKENYVDIDYDNGDEIVVFMKDDDFAFRKLRKFPKVLQITKDIGFGCFTKPDRETYGINALMLHDSELLDGLSIDDYSHIFGGRSNPYTFKERFTANFSEWRNKMDASYPDSSLVPVCYNGHFAIKRKALLTQSLAVWKKMEGTLLRGVVIEEKLFAERAWAPFLMSQEETDKLKIVSSLLAPVTTKVMDTKTDKKGRFIPYYGMLFISKRSEEFKAIAKRWLL